VNLLEKLKHRGSEWRYALRLWSDLGAKGRPVIVIPAELINAHDPATGTGECRSTSLVSVCCGALGARNLHIIYAHELLGDNAEKVQMTEQEQVELLQEQLGGADLILLGASLTNAITGIALKLLTIREPDLGILCKRDDNTGNHHIEFEGKSFDTEFLPNKISTPLGMTKDYGFFLVRPNCFSTDPEDRSRIFIFGGAHTYGTQAAAEMFFTPEGAAKVAARFGRRPSAKSHWQRELKGLIQVTPVKEVAGIPTMGLRLTERQRIIEIIKPPILARIQIENPVMSPAMDRFRFYAMWGWLRMLAFEFFSFLAVVLVSVGLYLHKPTFIVAGFAFYAIFRFIHTSNS